MTKKLLSLLLALCLILSLAACTGAGGGNNTANIEPNTAGNEAENTVNTVNTVNTENTVDNSEQIRADFDAFVKEQYVKSIEESYTSAHVYYLDPEAAGFDDSKIEKTFGLASTDEDYEEIRSYYKDLKTRLEGFDREVLTRRQQDEYDTLEWEINSVLAMQDEKFDYYEQLFAPPNSLEANIVSLLSTWEIRNEKDINDFVTLIGTLPAYVDSALEYAKKQQEKELFMTDFDSVINGCNDVINAGMDSFIINRLLGQVDDIEGLSDEKKTEYKDSLKAAFEASYLPSFVRIRDGISLLRDGYNNTEGYAAFPHGAEYFAALLNYSMGSYGLTGEDFLAEIEDGNNANIQQLMDLYLTDSEAIEDYYEKQLTTGYDSYEDILEDIKVKMLEDHPEVKNLSYHLELADVEEKLEEKSIAAYFVVPPLDGDHKQQIRVKPPVDGTDEELDSLDTYMTVTHEGFPGHMYQYAYLYDLDISDYLKTIGIDGMVEGYAVYSQYGALDYIDDPSVTDSFAVIAALDSKLSYLLYCELDLGINYEGWSLDDTKDFFEKNSYDLEEDVVKEVYDFLRFCPATYEPYGLGYEYIASLRAKAEDELGDKFSAKDFNAALLNAASAPRTVVERYIYEYIDSAK